jgi:DNA excision repair protein ERCC-4
VSPKEEAPTLFMSPAEPQAVKSAFNARMGGYSVSGLPEQYGVDMLWRTRGTWWGCQRKTVSDFVASLLDGRITREVAQMRTRVSMPTLLIEGRVAFTLEGERGMTLIGNGFGQTVTRKQWRGLMWSLASAGIAVDYTANISETAAYVADMMEWTTKARHTSLTARPKMVDSAWGTPGSRDWGVYLLQGFEGVGPGVAEAMWDHFGRVPLSWDCDGEELLAVPGLGKERVRRLTEALG